jgi:hypothetical protein
MRRDIVTGDRWFLIAALLFGGAVGVGFIAGEQLDDVNNALDRFLYGLF